MSQVLSAKARRNSSQNEQLWQTLDIGNVIKPTYDFKISNNLNLRNKLPKTIAILLISIFIHKK